MPVQLGEPWTAEDLEQWLEEENSKLDSLGFCEDTRDSNQTPDTSVPSVSFLSGCDEPPETAQLEAAVTDADLLRFREIYETWCDEKARIDHLRKPYMLAVEGDHIKIAEYILDQGLSVNKIDFQKVLEREAYPWMELFLDHG